MSLIHFPKKYSFSCAVDEGLFCRKVKQEQTLAAESTQPVEHKDYSLRAGQTIQLNLGVGNICNYNPSPSLLVLHKPCMFFYVSSIQNCMSAIAHVEKYV